MRFDKSASISCVRSPSQNVKWWLTWQLPESKGPGGMPQRYIPNRGANFYCKRTRNRMPHAQELSPSLSPTQLNTKSCHCLGPRLNRLCKALHRKLRQLCESYGLVQHSLNPKLKGTRLGAVCSSTIALPLASHAAHSFQGVGQLAPRLWTSAHGLAAKHEKLGQVGCLAMNLTEDSRQRLSPAERACATG